MNILIITAMFPPIQTGSSFYAEDVAKALKSRGHNVTVVTLENEEAMVDNREFPAHRLRAIHLENLFKNHFKHFRISSCFLQNYKRVNQIIKTNHSDIIFLVSHYHDIAFLAIVASLLNRIPLVCSVNTQLQLINLTTGKILNFCDRLICGELVLPFCQKILSLDTEIERYLTDVYKEHIATKSVIVPYGFHGDIEFFNNHNHDYELHNQLLGIGSIIEQRNFLSSITLFSKLINIFPNLRFKIIGHVYYDAALKLTKNLRIEDKVIFTGELPHQEVLEEIQKSDIYMGIISGKYVGLGTATLESMLMGIPVVANVPPNLFGENLLFDMQNYVYADLSRPEHLVEKITTLLQQKDLREKIGKNGKKLVKEHLDWDIISEKIENLFVEVCKKT